MQSHMFLGFALLIGVMVLVNGHEQDTGEGKIGHLIKKLGHEKFSQREAASKALQSIGEPALPLLRKAVVTASDQEVRLRAVRVIEAISRLVTRRELQKLQGTWKLVSYERDGKQISGENKAHLFIFKEDKWAIQIGGQLFQGGTVQRIEVKEKLNALDLLITQGSNSGATATSIYVIEGNMLKYLNCGNPRAMKFITKPGDGRHYLTFRRAAETIKK